MISARRAALLGLTVPLSPIMIAVLGLWPEPEDDLPELPTQVYGNGRRRRWSERKFDGMPLVQPRERTTPVDAPTPLEPQDDQALLEKVRRHWDEMADLREAQRLQAEAKERQAREDAQDAIAAAAAPLAAAVNEAPAVSLPDPIETAAAAAALRRRQDNDALAAVLIAELA